jgi:hypothetical protein
MTLSLLGFLEGLQPPLQANGQHAAHHTACAGAKCRYTYKLMARSKCSSVGNELALQKNDSIKQQQ